MAANFPDLLIIGAGINGLTLAHAYVERFPEATVTLIEKEDQVAQHASGRNSGVLHAGFYYSSNSLKARLSQQGNQRMQRFCEAENLPLNRCGKLVVTATAEEVPRLRNLYEQGLANGVPLHWITAAEARDLEPEVNTVDYALYSPSTATVDPLQVCQRLYEKLLARGVHFHFGTRFLARGTRPREIRTTRGVYFPGRVINCAGLYADKIATAFGLNHPYTLLPFKGLYLEYKGNPQLLTRHIYPVPDPRQPFLGVHYTRTVGQKLKIGPTAIPAFWRENYRKLDGFQWRELAEILWYESQLFIGNDFGFRELAFKEMQKYYKPRFAAQAEHLTRTSVKQHFGKSLRPGIRAQLLNTRTREMVKDFVVEDDGFALHMLNAVSPAFTCSFAFADYLLEHYL